jgi:outer membrane lipoprotein-sorting protein
MFVKKLSVLLIVLLFLGGCSGKQEELERAMTLRAKLLASECSFDAKITADYGDKLYVFAMTCQGDSRGNLAFTVTEPESIAGITGIISQDGGRLTFDDMALAFPLMADDQLTPVSAPWIFLKTLRGGYLTSANTEEELLHLTIDDSYEEDALQLDIWLDGQNHPVQADILYDGRRILTVQVSNFTLQ